MQARVLPCGDAALVLEAGDRIDAAVNARIIATAEMLQRDRPAGVTEIVPTYRSLLLCYDPEVIRGAALEQIALTAWEQAGDGGSAAARRWTVPCLYGGAVGQDLAWLADHHGLTPEALIAQHSAAQYRVYMIGFAPGFAYLGGLPAALTTPRLAVPRQLVPAGAIGIGGQQASINSVAGPSGWRYIGWTPLVSFDAARPEPCLFRAGDLIRFRPIDAAEAEAISAGRIVIAPEAAA